MAKKRSKRTSKTSAQRSKRKGKAGAAVPRRAQPKGVINTGHLYSPQRQMGEHRDVLCHHRFGVLLAHSRRAEAEQHFGDGSRKIGGARGGERRLQPIEADLQQRSYLL
jgi:hypothetical protein